MDAQDRVAAFVETHDLETPPAYRLLDLASEVGELAKGAATSTDYGTHPEELAVDADEVGDTLFALLALAERLDVDADDALDQSLRKYERRLAEGDSPGSED